MVRYGAGPAGLRHDLVHVLLDNLARRRPDVVFDDLRAPFNDDRLKAGRVVDTDLPPVGQRMAATDAKRLPEALERALPDVPYYSARSKDIL